MGKKLFSHLSAPPVPPFFPCLTFPSSSSSSPPSFFAFISSFLLLLLCAALRASPKCSYGVSTKGSDFSHSRREQGARLLPLPLPLLPVGIFQKLLSHPAISLHHTPLQFFRTPLLPSLPSVSSPVSPRPCEDREKTIDGASILFGRRASAVAESSTDVCHVFCAIKPDTTPGQKPGHLRSHGGVTVT